MMRVTESLIRQNNMNRQKKIRQSYEEEDEPTQAYQARKLEWWSINQQKSAFASPMEEGLNSNASVFDKQAVFRTGENV